MEYESYAKIRIPRDNNPFMMTWEDVSGDKQKLIESCKEGEKVFKCRIILKGKPLN